MASTSLGIILTGTADTDAKATVVTTISLEVVDEEVVLEEVTDSHGNLVAQDLPVDEVNFLEDDPFGGQDPDYEEYSGYTGNEGCNAT